MKKILLSLSLLTSCSLIVRDAGPEPCAGEYPRCDGNTLVTCDATSNLEVFSACEGAQGCSIDLNACDECGDGEVDAGEGCDDGAANSDTASDACRTTCEPASCGDNVVDTGEICDDSNDPNCSDTCQDVDVSTPVVIDDTDTVIEDSANNIIDVTVNDTGLDDGVALIQIDTIGLLGSASVNGLTVVYTPKTDFVGVDSLQYTLIDNDGDLATGNIDITVTQKDDDPQALADSATTNEDTPISIAVLANDILGNDPLIGDQPITLSIAVDPAKGTAAPDPNDSSKILYTPNPDQNGADSFTYRLQDSTNSVKTAVVNVTITSVNDTPDAIDDAISTNQDSSVVVLVLANDILGNDPLVGDQPVSLAVIANPANGTAIVNNLTNTITYAPNTGFTGTNTFTYRLTDGNGTNDTATVTVIIDNIDDIPVANDDTATTNEDTSTTTNVLTNDTKLTDGTITVAISNPPAKGSAVVLANNSIQYIPDPDANGADSYEYSVTDGDGDSDLATVAVTINSIDDIPIALNDALVVDEETSGTVDVLLNDDLGNDNKIGDQPVTVSIAVNPTKGVAVVNADKTITYTPNTDLTGADSLQYRIADGNNDTATGTVSITINNVNDVPSATNDAATTNEDVAVGINVLGNDTSLGDGVASVVVQTAPTKGSATVNADKTITYTPNPDQNGTDSFVYLLTDSNNDTASATVNLIVNSVNDNPAASNDNAAVNEDSATTTDVLANDNLGNNPLVGDQPITISIQTQGLKGTATVNPDNTITYTPTTDINGSDSYTYRITDGNGTTAVGTVNVAIASVDDLPDAIADSGVTDEDTAVLLNVLANDLNLGDGGIVVSIQANGANGTAVVVGANIQYTPALNFTGADSFTYRIVDSDGDTDTATVTVTINSIDDLPVAANDTATTNEDAATTTSVLTNDSGLGDGGLSLLIQTSPTNGVATVNAGANTITYTPNPDFNGTDSYVYRVTDADGDIATATVNITINSVNDIPSAVADTLTVNEDTAGTVNVLQNDTLGNSATIGDQPISIVVLVTPTKGVAVVNADKTITYTPNTDLTGADSLQYRIADGNNDTATGTVSITINNVNDVPSATNDAATTNEDVAVGINVLGNDTSLGDGVASVVVQTAPTKGSATVNADKTITYTPNPDQNGTDSFVYLLTDSNNDTASATVGLTINAVNDTPVASSDNATTNEDAAVTTNVLLNDVLGNAAGVGDQPITITILTPPAKGAASVNGDNTVTFTPNADLNGSDSYTYRITDGNGTTATSTVNLTINAVNDIPVASNDSASTNQDTQIVINVLANDILGNNPAIGDQPVTITNVSSPANGTAAIIGGGTSIRYTPNAGFVGSDTFTYQITDGNGTTSNATVSVLVDNVDDIPVAVNDADTTNEDTAKSTNVLVNDSGLLDAPLSLSIVTQGTKGTATINANNTILYTPLADLNGSDSYSYRITDGDGDVTTATVNITINSVNDLPVANTDNVFVTEDVALAINVLTNDILGNNPAVGDQPVTVSIQTTATKGVAVVNADKTITYTPNADVNGADSFVYRITDGNNDISTATVNVTINAVDDLVDAVNDNATVLEDSSNNTINTAANDTGLGDAPVTITIETQATKGAATVVNGTVRYTPTADSRGGDSFVYRLTDLDGDTDTATVNVTITDVDDLPAASNDTANTNEDAATTINVLANDVLGTNPLIGDQPVTVIVISAPTKGIASISANSIVYTPTSDLFGADSLQYRITDADGDTAAATVSITINARDDVPVANGDAISVAEDSSNNEILVLANDILGNNPLLGDQPVTVSISSDPAKGTAFVSGESIFYSPDKNFNGNDTLFYQVTDADGDVASAQVNITVTPTNDAPSASAGTASVNEDTSVSITLSGADIDGDSLTFSIVTPPTNGVLSGIVQLTATTARVVYTPNANFPNGSSARQDTFTFRVSDSQLFSAPATVTVTVNPVPDAPTAVADAINVPQDGSVTFNPTLNDFDVDGDAIGLTTITIFPTRGSAFLDTPTNTIFYFVNFGATGTDSLEYKITDSTGATSTATVTFTIQPAVCGNGIAQGSAGEQCDDGNTTNGDGCSSTCQNEFCSNNVLDSALTLPPNFIRFEYLAGDCTGPGNALQFRVNGVDVVGEPAIPDTACDCNAPITTFDITAANNPAVFSALVPGGDNTVQVIVPVDSDATKQIFFSWATIKFFGPTIASGFVITDFQGAGIGQTGNAQRRTTNACDAGFTGFGSNVELTFTRGNIHYGEEADDGNAFSGDGVDSGCQIEFCGDGLVNAIDEECDDFNTTNNDGCNSLCQIEGTLVTNPFSATSYTGNTCTTREHFAATGDDRGGIGFSNSNGLVLVNGDGQTGKFPLAINVDGTALANVHLEAMFTELNTQKIFSLALNGVPLGANSSVMDSVVEINAANGLATSNVIKLIRPINLGTGTGILSGFDRLVLTTSGKIFDISLAGPTAGFVDEVGNIPAITDQPTACESNFAGNFKFWGVAEFTSNTLFISYISGNKIVRANAATGATTTIANFTNLSDMCSFVPNRTNNRWYFHHEGTSQFRAGDETIGFCSATYNLAN